MSVKRIHSFQNEHSFLSRQFHQIIETLSFSSPTKMMKMVCSVPVFFFFFRLIQLSVHIFVGEEKEGV